MDRPRYRRRDPQRTGPIRNAGGAWRGGEPSYDSVDLDDDDPASYGVRAGYHLIDEQIRRGYETAEGLGPEPRTGHRHPRGRTRPPGHSDDDYDRYPEEPWSRYSDEHWHGHGGGYDLLSLPMRHLERLAREILNQVVSARPDPFRLAGLLFKLQVEALSELARVGLGGWAGHRPDHFHPYPFDPDDEREDPEPEGEPWWDWPAAPSVPTEIRSTVPIPVYVWSRERTEIDLDLRPGSQDLDLRVERLRPVDSQPIPVHVHTEAHDDPQPHTHTHVHRLLPEAEFISVHGLTLLGVRVPPGQPPGRYRGVVRCWTGGEPLGTLTVEVGEIPLVSATVRPETPPRKTRPKVPSKKAPAKPRPRARKKQ